MEHWKEKHEDHWSYELAVRTKGELDVENKHDNSENWAFFFFFLPLLLATVSAT